MNVFHLHIIFRFLKLILKIKGQHLILTILIPKIAKQIYKCMSAALNYLERKQIPDEKGSIFILWWFKNLSPKHIFSPRSIDLNCTLKACLSANGQLTLWDNPEILHLCRIMPTIFLTTINTVLFIFRRNRNCVIKQKTFFAVLKPFPDS